jgi:hypothetical protein
VRGGSGHDAAIHTILELLEPQSSRDQFVNRRDGPRPTVVSEPREARTVPASRCDADMTVDITM